jgi:hypothetical protein
MKTDKALSRAEMKLLGAALLLATLGCDHVSQRHTDSSPDSLSAHAANTCSSDHRFQKTDIYPVAMRADIALDTCTGQLCRTWPWEAKAQGSPWAIYQSLPLCSNLSAIPTQTLSSTQSTSTSSDKSKWLIETLPPGESLLAAVANTPADGCIDLTAGLEPCKPGTVPSATNHCNPQADLSSWIRRPDGTWTTRDELNKEGK